jgi:NRPS condensation-like uncharacterized protein
VRKAKEFYCSSYVTIIYSDQIEIEQFSHAVTVKLQVLSCTTKQPRKTDYTLC